MKICPKKKTNYQDSCKYLLVMGTINELDLIGLENICIYRNKVANDLNNILNDDNQNIGIVDEYTRY